MDKAELKTMCSNKATDVASTNSHAIQLEEKLLDDIEATLEIPVKTETQQKPKVAGKRKKPENEESKAPIEPKKVDKPTCFTCKREF
jgi:hypothetical protein